MVRHVFISMVLSMRGTPVHLQLRVTTAGYKSKPLTLRNIVYEFDYCRTTGFCVLRTCDIVYIYYIVMLFVGPARVPAGPTRVPAGQHLYVLRRGWLRMQRLFPPYFRWLCVFGSHPTPSRVKGSPNRSAADFRGTGGAEGAGDLVSRVHVNSTLLWLACAVGPRGNVLCTRHSDTLGGAGDRPLKKDTRPQHLLPACSCVDTKHHACAQPSGDIIYCDDLVQIIIVIFAIRQLQVIPQIFYSTSHFTMLILLIHTYIYTLRRLLSVLYPSNVFSNVIMCLITSCVSDATLYARIQSSTQTFVRSTLLLFLEKPQSFLLMERLILPKRNPTCYLSEYHCLKTDLFYSSASTLQPQIIGVDVFDASPALLPSSLLTSA